LLVLRPFGPRRELLPLHELLPLAHGVPLRINRCIMPYPHLWVQRGSYHRGHVGSVSLYPYWIKPSHRTLGLIFFLRRCISSETPTGDCCDRPGR
jgi:hypothetical protein